MNFLAKAIHDYNLVANAILNQADAVLTRLKESELSDPADSHHAFGDTQLMGGGFIPPDRAMWSVGFAASLFFRTFKTLPDPAITSLDVDDIDNLPMAELVEESPQQAPSQGATAISFDHLCQVCMSLPPQLRVALI